jgi:hypothetical protein
MLLKTIEDLYYAIYARLNIEIGNVQLCESFHFDIRRLALNQKGMTDGYLPEPSHLNLIFQACKLLLRSDAICGFLDKEIVRQHQADFVRRAVETSAANGYVPEDLLGYRRYIQKLVSDPQSPFCRKWCGLNPVYKSAPGLVLATLSEKYLVILPKEKKRLENEQIRKNAIARIIDPYKFERNRVLANREASSALLEGMTVGEYRRIEGKRSLTEYVHEAKCICFGFCSCALECTRRPDKGCPCSGRMSVICATEEPERGQNFPDRCSELAEAIFEGLGAAKRGTTVEEIAMELKTGLDLFHGEVIGYRRSWLEAELKGRQWA